MPGIVDTQYVLGMKHQIRHFWPQGRDGSQTSAKAM